jgi:3D (Asp-Asp-Asp) domain-containing protein
MLLLTSITDKLQVITSAAGKVDVHADWIDYAPAASPQVSAGRTNTPITTAATTDVVASPGASYLSGSGIPIGSRVQPGSFFKWRLRASKTAAGVATATMAVVIGPNGSTADTARVTHSSTAIQTAAVDTGMFEVDAVVRAVGAGAAIIESTIRLDHVLADAAGFGTFRYLTANSAAFTFGGTDIIGLVCNPGAAGVWTFQHVLVDAGNLVS